MAVAAGSIVEHLDVIKDIGLGEVSRFVNALLDTFLFQTTKEGFSDGVVPRADVGRCPRFSILSTSVATSPAQGR